MSEPDASFAPVPATAREEALLRPSWRILVVDDETSIREINTRILSHSGYTVEAAKDGAEAWDLLQRQTYNLLITDQHMPYVSGVELIQKIAAAQMALPVIMATGTIPENELSRQPWLKPAATLLKPYSAEQLLGTVRTVLDPANNGPKEIKPRTDEQARPSADARHSDF